MWTVWCWLKYTTVVLVGRMKLSVGLVVCLLLCIFDIVHGDADDGNHNHDHNKGGHNKGGHDKGGYGIYGGGGEEICRVHKCTDKITVTSLSFTSTTMVQELTKANAKQIHSLSTVMDVITEAIYVPACNCRPRLVTITTGFLEQTVPQLIEGCSPTLKVVTFHTLSTRNNHEIFNNCEGTTHEITLPRLHSTVLHSHANTFEFGTTKITKTEMTPVGSATSFRVCTAVAECDNDKGGYVKHNKYGPPPPPPAPVVPPPQPPPPPVFPPPAPFVPSPVVTSPIVSAAPLSVDVRNFLSN
ncbi:unnamed protein product, partial [Meganyctiphanes norvegica]